MVNKNFKLLDEYVIMFNNFKQVVEKLNLLLRYLNIQIGCRTELRESHYEIKALSFILWDKFLFFPLKEGIIKYIATTIKKYVLLKIISFVY